MHFISKRMKSFKDFIFSTLLFVSLVSFPTFGEPNPHRQIPNGSYQESCLEIRWNSNSDLEAKCKDNNRVLSTQHTKILNASYHLLNGNVANANGNLVASGVTPGGSWTQSCRWSTYNFSTKKLRAMCQAANRHNWFWSDVRASPRQEVENRDGHLVLR